MRGSDPVPAAEESAQAGGLRARRFATRYRNGSEASAFLTPIAIGEYIMRGPLIGSEVKVKKGSTPVHSVQCLRITQDHPESCTCETCAHHPPCSTITEEGMVHREGVEAFIGALFSHLRKLEGLS